MALNSQIASRSANGRGTDSRMFLRPDLSTHACRRMQQRGISAAALDALLDFGRTARAGRSRELVFFNSYAIVGSDGTVITVGHRFRRVQRDR